MCEGGPPPSGSSGHDPLPDPLRHIFLDVSPRTDPGESDPTRRDSDGGLSSDYVEVVVDGTDPLNGEDDLYDSDGDGIPDRLEWLGTFTDSFLPDSDFDGLCDGPGTVEGQCVGGEDTNGNGFQDPGESDPSHFDSDLDGLCDGPGTSFVVLDCIGDESALGTNLLAVDSDADGLSDLNEYSLTHDVDGNIVATCPSPLDSDCDWDGLLDGVEVVETDSGLLERSDPCLQDTDGDGINDGKELFLGLDPLVADATDSDGDGYPDLVEEMLGTDPNNPDSDLDGASDGEEAQNETDGLDPNDKPGVPDEDKEGVSDGLETIMGTDPKNPDTDGDGAR